MIITSLCPANQQVKSEHYELTTNNTRIAVQWTERLVIVLTPQK